MRSLRHFDHNRSMWLATIEGFAWDSLVYPSLTWQNVSTPADWHGVAQNNTRLVVSLPGLPRYEIHSPETISLMIPSSAVISGRATRLAAIVVRADAGEVRVAGTLSDGCTDAAVRAAASQEVGVVIHLGDAFLPSVGMQSAATQQLLQSIQAISTEPSGFASFIHPSLSHHSLLRLNESAIFLRLPASPAYELVASETIVPSI